MSFYDRHKQNKLHLIVNWIVDIAAVIALACFTVYSFGGRIEVSGSSMNPALNSGDVVLVNRLAYDLGRPGRFDIAAFVRPGSGVNIKRVIGLPGETVQIVENQILIDGEPLKVRGPLESVTIPGVAEYPIELGADEYFLLGDNHDSSEDSRFATIGNIRREQFVGRVWLRFQPFSDFGLIN